MPCLAEEDPNAKNGLMTKVWGPAGWLFLHCISFGYPENPQTYDLEHGHPVGSTRVAYRRFFQELGNVFPCRYCRDSYKDFVRDDPVDPHLGSRDELVTWFWRIHNRVNEKLGLSYCDANIENIKTRYETYRAKCKAPTEDERSKNKEKGCVTPADGTPKRCSIQVVKTQPCHMENLKVFAIVGMCVMIVFALGYIVGTRNLPRKKK